jgi:hypothetical protein
VRQALGELNGGAPVARVVHAHERR